MTNSFPNITATLMAQGLEQYRTFLTVGGLAKQYPETYASAHMEHAKLWGEYCGAIYRLDPEAGDRFNALCQTAAYEYRAMTGGDA